MKIDPKPAQDLRDLVSRGGSQILMSREEAAQLLALIDGLCAALLLLRLQQEAKASGIAGASMLTEAFEQALTDLVKEQGAAAAAERRSGEGRPDEASEQPGGEQ